MALKDWQTYDNVTFTKPYYPVLNPYTHTTQLAERFVQVIFLDSPVQESYNKHPNTWYVSIWDSPHIPTSKRIKKIEKFFNTKSQAIKFAKEYMKKH